MSCDGVEAPYASEWEVDLTAFHGGLEVASHPIDGQSATLAGKMSWMSDEVVSQ